MNDISDTKSFGDFDDEFDCLPTLTETQAALKKQLLAHYAKKTPNAFIQIDGWPPELCDSCIPNIGGCGLTVRNTFELMSGGPCVRVLVVPGTPSSLVTKILKEAADFYPKLNEG